MRQSGKGSGGGLGMNKNVRRGMSQGDRARAMNPKGATQVGTNRGNHATNSAKILRGDRAPVRGNRKPVNGPGGVPLGNALATNVGNGGPGAGRTLYGQGGSQGLHGPVDRGMPGLPSTKGQWPD